MMRRVTPIASVLLLISACISPPLDGDVVRELPPRKQKQKISAMQKKLEATQKEEAKLKKEAEFLREEIDRSHLTMIRKIVEEYEKKLQQSEQDPSILVKLSSKDPSELFFREREILYTMIQEGPSPASLEAQNVLDRILRVITFLSDES